MLKLAEIIALVSCPLVQVLIVLIAINCFIPSGTWLHNFIAFICALIIFFGIIVGFLVFCCTLFK